MDDELTPELFWSILHAVPEPKPIFWRLYYDDQGNLITYSMEQLPHAYIDIDPELYQRGPLNVRVVNGEIRYRTLSTVEKLVPNDQGLGTECDPRNVAIVAPGQHWSRQVYD